ncbi:coproporphyrinogen dehydrogenase HemZ [Natroniella sp. ANB-PHB2]|uniref:coproporphyrinogen dehydrogenase HemZ n=1 Tax=Natroniella sp. ANB-PHB2 TaxID=3384444 RepID=UPI0038D4CF5E
MKLGLDLEDKYYNSVKSMLNILLPDLDIYNLSELSSVEVDLVITVELELSHGITVKANLIGEKRCEEEIIDQEILESIYEQQDFARRIKHRIKLSIFRVLSNYFGHSLSPWGILIGVRPTKLGHYLLKKGFSYQEIEKKFKDIYGVAQEKIALLLQVINTERNYLLSAQETKKRISIYLGIPFCPSKCNYCSFASYPVKEHKDCLNNFLAALNYELECVGQQIKELGLIVDTIYIGGGTPTVLTAEQLGNVLNKLTEEFVTDKLREFTVEAGRVDTINQTKLKLLNKFAPTRISINPQTMNQTTLDRIGRQHTVKRVKEVFKIARQLGFENINMDLIVGLPGEKKADLTETLQQIKRLQPDNLTVHTLAIKRASQIKRNLEESKLPANKEVEQMLSLTKEAADQLGLKPYYMYRQKNTLANLENIGFAKEGKESIYNILMMEERQTIIGLGGGAVTKLLDPWDWSLKRLFNPKSPFQYIEEVEERTIEKISKLTSLIR